MTLSLLLANDKPTALAKLPQGERKDWQAFWSEIATLLKKAGSS
jgi:hypothetical protein